MRQLIDNRDLGVASDDGLHVHFFERHAPVFDAAQWYLLKISDQGDGIGTPVRFDEGDDEMKRRYLERVSLRRMVSPHDVAAMVTFLLSPMGENLSGQSLGVDGNVETL